MKVLIIEDEQVAAQQLRRLLSQTDSSIEITAVLQSIEESVEYFSSQPLPDLTFMDIHLADGSAFRIFDQVEVTCPVVFTTAYDQYALQAFQVNSIDYLLKPISPTDLERALNKYRQFSRNTQQQSQMEQLIRTMLSGQQSFPSKMLIPQADKLVPLDIDKIACLYLENKLTHILTYDGGTLVVDKPLDSMMEQLNPTRFYRVNRQYVVAHGAIEDISYWLLGKLKLNLKVNTPDSVVVPKAKVPEFKDWFSRG